MEALCAVQEVSEEDHGYPNPTNVYIEVEGLNNVTSEWESINEVWVIVSILEAVYCCSFLFIKIKWGFKICTYKL